MELVTKKVLLELEQSHITTVSNNLSALISRGFKVVFDRDSCSGVASKSDLEIKFSIGGENVYFDYSASTKYGVEVFIERLTELHRNLD